MEDMTDPKTLYHKVLELYEEIEGHGVDPLIKIELIGSKRINYRHSWSNKWIKGENALNALSKQLSLIQQEKYKRPGSLLRAISEGELAKTLNELTIWRAQIEFAAGYHREALGLANMVLRDNPDNTEALELVGQYKDQHGIDEFYRKTTQKILDKVKRWREG